MKRSRLFRYAPMSRWTAKLAMRRMECRIEDAKAALADIAGIWGDVDQGAVDTVDQMIVDLDRFLADQKAMVGEKIAAGEYVGS